ncbi:HEAT repeat domain-containing protein [Amycolatopsis halotolerans]|uniref:HEAT repeat domain-containing protein n=1 Tax=Amycolatopsis halotolerans TaxID=330083 RepID=UPI003622E77B
MDVRGSLKEILRAPDQQAAALATELVRAEDTGVDDAILAVATRGTLSGAVVTLAIRILVERDRDRDPAPLLDLVPDGQVRAEDRRPAWPVRAPIVTRYRFGFSRLRPLDPVAQYERVLDHYPAVVRMDAAVGLGDSGEISALDPLAKALKDRNPAVRTLSANAVRRLGNAGLREAAREHPVRELLIDLLQDILRETRIAAARALASLGELEVLAEHRPKSARDQREWARMTRGEIPPLKRTWPGDLTI